MASTLCESEKSDVCMFVVDFPIRKSVRNLWLYSFAGITEKDRWQNGQELVFVGYTCACVMRPCEGVYVCASISVTGGHVH